MTNVFAKYSSFVIDEYLYKLAKYAILVTSVGTHRKFFIIVLINYATIFKYCMEQGTSWFYKCINV